MISDAATSVFAAGGLEGEAGEAVGGDLAFFSHGNTAETADDFSAVISWGDGSSSAGSVEGANGFFTVNGEHTYSDGGAYTASIVVYDDFGEMPVYVPIDVADMTAVDHTLSATPLRLEGTEGVPLLAVPVATLADENPAHPLECHDAVIYWGDGSSSPGLAVDDGGEWVIAGSHTYEELGSYLVSTHISDEWGHDVWVYGTASIGDLVPMGTITAAAVSGGTGQELDNVYLGTVTVTQPFDEPAVTVEWGDSSSGGATLVGSTGDSYWIMGSHAYADAGIYMVRLVAQDPGGDLISATSTATIGEFQEGVAKDVDLITFADANPLATEADYTVEVDPGEGERGADHHRAE